MLHLDLLWPIGAHSLHKLSLPPLLLPQLFPSLSYCHLHLHSGPFQWREAFIFAVRHDADTERGCSALEDYALGRAYAIKRSHLRPVQPESHFSHSKPELKSEESVSINHAVQFRRNAFVWERLDPARLKLLLQIEQAPAHRYKTTDSQMNLYQQTCQLLQKINQRLNSRQALLYLWAYACKWACAWMWKCICVHVFSVSEQTVD